MLRRSVVSLSRALLSSIAPALLVTAAQGQALTAPASNITPDDTRSVIAPALPTPPVPSADPPSFFLRAARVAVAVGHTGEAQEALERAETRLLDRSVQPIAASVPDNQHEILSIGAARRALAAHDGAAAIAAIDDALAVGNTRLTLVTAPRIAATVAAPPVTLAPVPPLEPVVTRARLPGYWTLRGARYVWVPPENTLRIVDACPLVFGTNVWRDGRWVYVPTHYAAACGG